MFNNFDPLTPIDPYQYGPPVTPGDPEEADRMAMYGCLSLMATPGLFIIVFCIIALLTGCTTTRYVTVPEVHHDTVRITKHERDSIYLHDSIYVNQYTKGDTVFLQVEKWHTQYRDRWHTDTAYISRRDSVPVPYPVEVSVPAQLNWFQQMRLWIGSVVLIALAILAAIWMIKNKAWFIRLLR